MNNRSLTAVPGLRVGHAHDETARTGCTVVLGPFTAAVDVRGLATGTRELDSLSPLHLVSMTDAIVLAGGSAFGLAAADGVVQWLEAEGRGFPTSAGRVPIVPGAVLYDLAVGRADVRPDAAMGRQAAASATADPVPEGSVGAGTGATVGKLRGSAGSQPGGIGSWANFGSGFSVGALVAVNAFGDVLDVQGRVIAGTRSASGEFLDTRRALEAGEIAAGFEAPRAGESTTLAVVATDAPLDRTQLQVVARQAMNGIVRRVSPSNTPFDGDVVFALSTAEISTRRGERLSAGEILSLALRAQAALERSIGRAVVCSEETAAE